MYNLPGFRYIYFQPSLLKVPSIFKSPDTSTSVNVTRLHILTPISIKKFKWIKIYFSNHSKIFLPLFETWQQFTSIYVYSNIPNVASYLVIFINTLQYNASLFCFLSGSILKNYHKDSPAVNSSICYKCLLDHSWSVTASKSQGINPSCSHMT